MENKKIKVAEIIGDAKTGGIISCVFNYYKHLNKNDFKVDFIISSDSPYQKDIENLGGKLYKFHSVYNPISSIVDLIKIFKKEKYDIVHAHMTTLSIIPLFAAMLAGVKVRICHAHSMSDSNEKFRHLIKNLLRPLSKIFANKYAGCSDASIKWLFGKKVKNYYLMHNAIDINNFKYDKFVSDELRTRYSIQNKKVLGFVGRFVTQKNLLFLIDAFDELCNGNDDYLLVLVGSGKNKEMLEQAVEKYKLNDKVLFLGETKDVNKVYSMFDIFVLPSLYEGLPLVAVEAQVNGLPCILSSNITQEVKLTNLCKFLPISDPHIWVNEILNTELNKNRVEYYSQLENSKYDIIKETKRLEEYYKGLINNGKC